MKLITLNTWGGRVGSVFFDFIKNNQDIDIFCFQELYYESASNSMKGYEADLDVYPKLQKLLPNHVSFFSVHSGTVYGIGIFVRRGIEVLAEGDVCVFSKDDFASSDEGDCSRTMRWVRIKKDQKVYTIANVHGLWSGRGKSDSIGRIAQSETIRKFMDSVETPKIICGDFNLRPDTQSIKLLENGMVNLIKKYDIQSTRTQLYKKEEKFADYIFTSPDIIVKEFAVLPDQVSDHAPLLLEF